MSELIRILLLVLLCGSVAALLHKTQPVFAFAVALSGGLAAFFLCVRQLQGPLATLLSLAEQGGITVAGLQTVCKAVGIGCLCELVSSVCFDCGQSGLASKVDLAGKVAILGLCVPFALRLFAQVQELLS